MKAERQWRCARHGIVQPLPPDDQGRVNCPECGWMLIAQRLSHPEREGPDFFVFRGTGTAVDGVWRDSAELGNDEFGASTDPTGQVVRMVPTGEFETNEKGAVAEVWRPAT